MKNNRIIINSKKGYTYFDDLIDASKMFCITHDVYEQVNEISKKVNFLIEMVSDEIMIKAYPLGPIAEKNDYLLYDIISEIPIDFPVNRIHWMSISYDPNFQNPFKTT